MACFTSLFKKWVSKEFVLIKSFCFTTWALYTNERCIKMLELRVNFYKYTLRTIPLSIMHGNGILNEGGL